LEAKDNKANISRREVTMSLTPASGRPGCIAAVHTARIAVSANGKTAHNFAFPTKFLFLLSEVFELAQKTSTSPQARLYSWELAE
jgi:hypothetical protein